MRSGHQFESRGIAFQLVVVLSALVHLGKIGAESLIRRRRHVIVGIFVLGAVLTPPDVVTQGLVATPMVLLYEAVILYAKCIRSRRSLHLNDSLSPNVSP